jgi:putative ABC transport system permease protein
MIFLMAWRNIWRNKMRSLVIMLSVAIGFFASVAVLAISKGMVRSRVRTVIDREIGHLQIHEPAFKKDYNAVYTIIDKGHLQAFLNRLPEVKSFTTRSIAQGMLATATGSAGVQIKGIISSTEDAVSQLDRKIIEGNGFDNIKHNQVLIGKKLSDKLKIKLNNKVVLTFTDKDNTISSAAFRVTGIYQTINTPLDERNVFVQQKDINELLGIDNHYHEVAVILKQDEQSLATKQKIQKQFPSLLIETWNEISPETELMVVSSNQYIYILVVIIMLALAFGIINTMLMAVLERTREIGMITALGMNKLKLTALILCETVFLTLAGTPLGFAMAWICTEYFSKTGINISRYSKEAMSNFGFESVIYPEFPFEKILNILIIVLLTALLASVFPTIKALKLQPADALNR